MKVVISERRKQLEAELKKLDSYSSEKMPELFPERNPKASAVEPEQVKSLLGDSFANWKEFIDSAPKFRQRQDAMNNQLKDLYYVANKLGFYDAADYLRNFA